MSKAELETVRKLSLDIETAGKQAEIDCRFPAELIQRLAASGIFATMIPERYGGTQRPPFESLQLIEELAYADSAAGWSAMIYMTTAMLGAFLPERWGKEIYGVTRADGLIQCPLAAGAAAPSGVGKPVEGGIVVSGRWAWGSGTHNSQWIAGGTLVLENGEMRKSAAGAPINYIMFFERSAVQLHDNWDPSGLRGTGSVDFEVSDYFVPDGRWVILGDSEDQVEAPLYRFPFYGFFATAVASVPIGIARRALDDYQLISQARGSVAKATSISRLEFGRSEALLAAAQHLIKGAVTDCWQRILEGHAVSLEDRRQLRLAASQATIMCADAVDRLYNVAGGMALQGHCSLQKHFRDVHAATQHRMVSPEILRMAAGIKLDSDSSGQL